MKYLRGLITGTVVGFFGTLVLEAYLTMDGSDWMEKTVSYWRSL